jgi:serine/threonine-protein kinase
MTGQKGPPDRTLQALSEETGGGRTRTDMTEPALPREAAEADLGRFGRYRAVRQIATGGMGELLLAREGGIEGFEREVVVKVLLPHLNADREFVTMFLDEARIAARLTHPNIVQILELGEEQGRYFIAMELIDGVNLADLLVEALGRGERGMPLEVALPIAIDVCSALHYAHERKDRFDRPLNIVHRDVSPHNVLVGYDGSVKLTDFGVAAAENKVHRTQSGTVKGKMTFMSPEQARAKAVDRRSDVFALGIVLYVMLTGSHPFEPEHVPDERDAGGIQTLLRIVNAPVRDPRKIRRGMSKRLARVILRMLKKDPAARFATAGEVRLALEEIVAAERILVSRDAIAAYVREIVPERVADWESRTGVRRATEGAGVHQLVDTGRKAAALPEGGASAAPRRPRIARAPLAAGLGAFVLALVATIVVAGLHRGTPRQRGSADLVQPASLGTGADGGIVAATSDGALILDWGDADTADGAAFDDDGGAVMDWSGVSTGTISLDTSPPTTVLIGGNRLGRTPLESALIPVGAHRIRLRSARHGLDYTLPGEVVVEDGENVDLGHVSVARGTMRFAVFPWARIAVDGRPIGVTPMPPVAVYPGSHRIVLACGDGRGRSSVRRRVVVRPREVTVVRHSFQGCE